MQILVPEKWEINSLDTTHILFDRQGVLQAEIKWSHAPGRADPARWLKQFIHRSQRQLGIVIHEARTPEAFSPAQPDLQFFFFSWESKTNRGNGALVFCARCKKLTLIRFFTDPQKTPSSLHQRVLASFQDHSDTGLTRWQVFGLTFFVPESFTLHEYSLVPGAYAIRFIHRKKRLDVFSWGPAEFLLKNTDLSAFAAQRIPSLKGFATAGGCCRGNYLEWAFKTQRFKHADMVPMMNRWAQYSLFRICHDRKHNRIYGVLIQSPKQHEHDLMNGSVIGND